jgi:hypothetical protein
MQTGTHVNIAWSHCSGVTLCHGKEEIIGLLMAQYLFGIDLPEKTFQVLTYQAIAD